MTSESVLTSDNCIDAYALARIDYFAGRLEEAYGLDRAAVEDLQQDMVVELLKAANRHDPARSRRRTFVNRVLERLYRHLARALRIRQRCTVLHPKPVTTLRNFTSDAAAGHSLPERIDLAIDLAEFLGTLPPRLRRLCEELRDYSPAEVARRSGRHRSTIYEAIAELREHFSAAGFENSG